MSKRILTIIVGVLLISTTVFAESSRTFVKEESAFVHQTNAIRWTPEITGKAEIHALTIHFDQPTDEDIGVFLNSEEGATYDTVLATSDSVELQNFFWQPDSTFILERNDDITVYIESGSGEEAFTATLRGDYK